MRPARLLIQRLGARLAPAVPPEPPTPPPPPRELIVFLRDLAVALCESGEASNQVALRLEALARRYGAGGVRLLVLPTSVFVRTEPVVHTGSPAPAGSPAPDGADDTAADNTMAEDTAAAEEMATGGMAADGVVDFAPVTDRDLTLEQISGVYDLVAEAGERLIPPAEGSRRLAAVLATKPRFSAPVMLVGHVILTVGLGLLRDPTAAALTGYAVLGLVVGLLRLAARKWRGLSLALPVVAALTVTAISYRFAGPLAGGHPVQLLIPPLVTLLPGVVLTVGTMELATGAMVAGASRLIYGFNVLFLLAFGILAGVQGFAGHHQGTATHTGPLGWWAPWLGVLLLGAGFFMYYSAPARCLPWLLAALYLVWAVQLAGSTLAGGLLGAFLAAAAVPPAAALMQRPKNGPTSQVTFLTSFWMLVPGAIGLNSVSELLGTDTLGGVADLVNALLVVTAIALGVLVGTSLTRPLAPALPML
jgi:uncharacterized membrane protein YjjP (DUF1212 family)